MQQHVVRADGSRGEDQTRDGFRNPPPHRTYTVAAYPRLLGPIPSWREGWPVYIIAAALGGGWVGGGEGSMGGADPMGCMRERARLQ